MKKFTSKVQKCITNKNYYILLILCWTIYSGCSTYHVYQIGGTEGRELGNQPGTEWKGETKHSFLWGLVRQDVAIENCKLGDGTRINIEEIKVEKNFGCMIATVATLGLWEPVKISWRCAKPCKITDVLD